MRLQILSRELTDARQLARFHELERTVQLAISRLRHLLFALHPPALDSEGLSAALRLHIDGASGPTGRTAYRLVDRFETQPPPATAVMLYRITRELLAYVEREANASIATVTLSEVDGGYLVQVDDDGDGAAPGEPSDWGHLGFQALRDRAELAGGWLKVDATPGEGSVVDVWIPALTETVSTPNPGAPR